MECPPTPPTLPEGGIPSPEPVISMKTEEPPLLPRCGSPEPNCTICLGALTDRSNTDICAHKFCYTCILTWSKVKSECPLCKQKFSMIYHDYQENGSHSVYTVPRPIPDPVDSELHGNYFMVVNMPNLQLPILPVPFMRRNINRHRLPNNPAVYSRFRRSIPRPMALSAHDNLPPARGTRSQSQSRLIETVGYRPDSERISGIERRRQIYALNQWALPLPDLTGRTREYSLNFFIENQAVTHRLTAWILRDLSVLLSETRIYEASQRISEMLLQHDLRSPEFSNEVRRFLGDRTRHFMHELISYSRSPYDMIGYDRSSSYGNWDPTLETYLRHSQGSETPTNDEDIVEVTVERTPFPYPSMRERLNYYRQRDTDRWSRIYARLRSIQDYSARAGEILNFPMPSPSSAFTAFSTAPQAPLPNALAPPSVTVQPVAGPSGLARSGASPTITSIVLDSSDDESSPPAVGPGPSRVSDDDDVEVVGEYKSRNQKTPELIELNSDVEEEEVPLPETTVVVDTTVDMAEEEMDLQTVLDDMGIQSVMAEEQPSWITDVVVADETVDTPEPQTPPAPVDKKRKRHRSERDGSASPKKHKKHKKKRRSSKGKKMSPEKRREYFYGFVSSDEEEDPLEYVPPKTQPKSYSSSDDEESLPRIRSVVVSSPSFVGGCQPSS